ncbi:MAG: hypothetical protein ACHQ51_04350 [Elusimicrobiota bacterium]
MNSRRGAALAVAAALAAGCSLFRWSGHPDPEFSRNWVWSTEDLRISGDGAKPSASLPPEKLPDTLYYADLGPETVDVTDYPPAQRKNYALFQKECARCHTAARAVNSPAESRSYWKYHLARMNLHTGFRSLTPLTDRETADILDFLDYDTQVRKVRDAKRFDETTEELKKKFEPILNGLLDKMRESAVPRPAADQ